MFLRFKEKELSVIEKRIRTIDLKKVWQITKSEWRDKWSIRIDIGNNYANVADGLTADEADDVEYKIIQGMMSKENGVLEIK